ncbi:MAG: Zn-dependent M28 family amino/carboxypeptidase [Paraglaciecola sp.]|jgi:Zn-dependent M28 family amino/carboxypeptidase
MNNALPLLQSQNSRKKLLQYGLVGLSVLLLAGCGESNDAAKSEKIETKTTNPFENSDFKAAYDGISIPNLKKHIQYLSSDELGGREPASEGDKVTANYLINEFKQLGLKPGNGDSYLQQVDLLAINSTVSQGLKIGDMEFSNTENYVASTRNKEKVMSLKDSELVFVGYGINAPEFGWNDYRGLDVKGKTVVILVNDPGYATQDPEVFSGKTMTYYGRWTYKYEEAGRQGAAGAIIIHETKPASYGWSVIKNGWTGTQFHLPRNQNSGPVVDVELWIDVNKTQELFTKAGLDFEKEKLRAQTKEFTPVTLGMNASVEVTSKFSQSTSNNVVAVLPGSEKPDEHIIYMAHIDHLGTDTSLEGDQIYNGAHDNASGIGGIIEIARAYSSLKNAPRRSITFVGAAAEEQGTLGSKYYADNPTIPLSKVVGLINMDSINITGRKKDVSVKGNGKSELEEVLAKAAALQNRTLTPEAHPERGYYFRSDHFSLAKKGVPGLSVGGGTVALNETEEVFNKRISERIGRCYHQLCDEYAEDWGWDGAKEDLQLYYATGYLLSTSDQWPNWYQGTEFRLLRDEMMN